MRVKIGSELVVAGMALAAVLGMEAVAGVGDARGEEGRPAFSSHVSAGGEIRLPEDFRVRMVHLGSWFVPSGDASGFHDVYTERESAEFFRRHRRFPDGATLVKELRVSRAANYTTGADVSHATSAVKQWFVMVKDDTNRFPGNPNWGEGWGWALFKSAEPGVNVSRSYQTDCLGCHLPAKATDWVYVNGYPTLQSPSSIRK